MPDYRIVYKQSQSTDAKVYATDAKTLRTAKQHATRAFFGGCYEGEGWVAVEEYALGHDDAGPDGFIRRAIRYAKAKPTQWEEVNP